MVWHCKCDCGNEIDVRSWNLTSGKSTSCGCSRSITAREINGKKLLGQRFGKLLVVEELPFEPDKSGNVYWRCKCDCGNETILYTSLLTQGISSCGCLNISRGELKIGELLGKAGISFEREKTFETCCLPNSSRLLRFDFYVNDSYIIEFDGIQHFQADTGWATQEVHERVAAHDEYKNNLLEIVSLDEKSTGALYGLMKGDVLLKINQTEIKGLEDLRMIKKEMQEKKQKFFYFKILRAGRELLIGVAAK